MPIWWHKLKRSDWLWWILASLAEDVFQMRWLWLSWMACKKCGNNISKKRFTHSCVESLWLPLVWGEYSPLWRHQNAGLALHFCRDVQDKPIAILGQLVKMSWLRLKKGVSGTKETTDEEKTTRWSCWATPFGNTQGQIFCMEPPWDPWAPSQIGKGVWGKAQDWRSPLQSFTCLRLPRISAIVSIWNSLPCWTIYKWSNLLYSWFTYLLVFASRL